MDYSKTMWLFFLGLWVERVVVMMWAIFSWIQLGLFTHWGWLSVDCRWLLVSPWLGHWALFHVSFTFLQQSNHIPVFMAGIQEEVSSVMQEEERWHVHVLPKLLLVSCLLIQLAKASHMDDPRVRMERHWKLQYYNTGKSLIGTINGIQ